MIIFGTRGYLRVLAMVNFICNNCHNPAAQRVVARITRFTLFFIPLFPIAKSYTTTCTFCGFSQRINKDLADQYAANGQQPTGGPVGPPASRSLPASPARSSRPAAVRPAAQYPQPQQYGSSTASSPASSRGRPRLRPAAAGPAAAGPAACSVRPAPAARPAPAVRPAQQHGQAQSEGNQHFGDPSAPQFPR